ncbi:hypothetical protein P154DRAFT_535899 [Amniculicola lignicola CBS 123094]|uniref:Uncharacterized protein n=1 Tax=Amniculicola lignicola CBS 123094 TaxID=1392246 RepID=A0A6A5WAW7_9PLEO|nr:hypothetical protein P154DRAFT_535899 [Amniculicola lignicola CBS 123094]
MSAANSRVMASHNDCLVLFDLLAEVCKYIYELVINSHDFHTLNLNIGKPFVEFMYFVLKSFKLVIGHPYHVDNLVEILEALPLKRGLHMIREAHFTHFDTANGPELDSSLLEVLTRATRLAKLKIDLNWSAGRGSKSISRGRRTFVVYNEDSGSQFGYDWSLTETFKMKELVTLEIEATGESRPGRISDV